MEKIEFLVSTGVNFFTPECEIRLPGALLQKSWQFRVLQSPTGAFGLQHGNEAISNAVTQDDQGDQKLTDVGGLSVRFGDILDYCMGKWLPMPLLPKSTEDGVPCRSVDWARLFLYRSPLQTDDNIIKMVIAIDTSLQSGENCGLFSEDTGVSFVANPGQKKFWQTPALLNWLKIALRGIPAVGDEHVPPYAISLAAFFALIDGLKQADALPEITVLRPEGEEIPVNLFLDLGNSRACGIFVEQPPGQSVSLDECCKLEIRDLQQPGEVYTEPFDTSFKFQPPLFYDPENAIPQNEYSFAWPSIVRLGTEAARLEPSDIGDTGMSSPKRYLWDEEVRHFPWYFNLSEDGLGKKVVAPFLKYLDENGLFKGDQARPPFEPCYPPGSLMTFLMLELLCHTYAQINSFNYRKSRGYRLAGRTLKNIVITTPCGMSQPEMDIYRCRIQSAIDLFFYITGRNVESKPQIHLDLDEATAVQLTYLYGETKNRFLGNSSEAVLTPARERIGADGVRRKSFRLASIDIGGGTSDLMIAEYYPDDVDQTTICQKMLFSEGFSIAGDEIAKRIIEKIILRHVFTWAQSKNPNITWEEFQIFFGPGRGGRDKSFNDMKAELCRQVWIPMAHRHLEFAELDTEDPDMELSFDRFFPWRLPGSNVLDFFANSMKKDLGCDITLPEIPWEISRNKVNSVISNVMENVLRIFSEVIAQFDCDVLILGGKPSSLPVIREILLKLMPVPSSKIIGLKGYSVGSWYPFAQKGGGISDPKTACVMGAAVWLFAEKLNNLDDMSLRTYSNLINQRECFIGTFSPEVMTLENCLFPTQGETPATLITSKTTMLGMRRIDSDICMVNPIWEVKLDRDKLKSNGPFEILLEQEQQHRECLKIAGIKDEKGNKVIDNPAELRLRTMVTDQYWLDTGSFDL